MLEIRDVLGDSDLYLQLAEEAAELSAAATKMARHIEGRNPTAKDKNFTVCYRDVIEELSDVINVCDILQIKPNDEIMKYKANRWKKRLFERSI